MPNFPRSYQRTWRISRANLLLTVANSMCTWLGLRMSRRQESCREVEAVISYLKPQVVFLELCSSRVGAFNTRNLKDLKVPSVVEMVEMWGKNHNLFAILYIRHLAKIARLLEVVSGSEFRVAYEEARKYGANVILGDRPNHITWSRISGKATLGEKITLLFVFLCFQALVCRSREDLCRLLKDMDGDDKQTLQEMKENFPTLFETLIDERDHEKSTSSYGGSLVRCVTACSLTPCPPSNSFEGRQRQSPLYIPHASWKTLLVFFPQNLAKMLGKYDHRLWYYIGAGSEIYQQNKDFGFKMTFGGEGFAISYPLAKVFDSCIERYPHLYGSDSRIYTCLAELGVGLTSEPGFHQTVMFFLNKFDVRENAFDLLATHPLTPLVPLHHLNRSVG
ncbi:hypothetical protein V6N12_005045 [Hibiscus sabdariffa]|uniref:Uncharacterized protein n=1 Tax=Hibiscus sabdariffa TaxID=183260 RepID=A0ABR2CNB0_9ROSI